VLVTLVAAYNTAIDLALSEIKRDAARAQTDGTIPTTRSSSPLGSSDSSAQKISTQCLADALNTIETGIPPAPLTPPAPPAAGTQQNGRQSGEAGIDIWSEPPDEENVNVLTNADTGKIRAGTLNKLVQLLTSPTHAGILSSLYPILPPSILPLSYPPSLHPPSILLYLFLLSIYQC
jgi:hypothetical protein